MAVLLASVGVIVAATPASALSLPSGFSLVSVPTGASNLTNFAFLPDGTDTMLVIGKCGPVRRVTQTGTSVAVSFTPSGTTVNCEGDRGLVGIDLARDYATSGTVYLTYNYKDAAGKYWGRLSKVTVNSVTAPTAFTNEQIIIDQFPSFSSTAGATCDTSHTVGTVLVAPDGTLYVGNGDSSSYCNVDNSALGAQDITSPRGKILHINPDGSGVSSNPFYQPTNPTSWQSRVFALGFRNPFRFSLKPGTSTLYIGDVGWNSYEEIDVAKGGENFGWPCWEGPPTFRNGYDALSQCQALYANPPPKLTTPLYYWNHFNSGGDAGIGGVVYTGSTYPADYQGAFFFGDYVAGRLWTVRTDANDAIVRAPETNGFGTAVGSPVAFRSGPNNDIFYADIGSGNVQRLRYAAGNRAPTAVATADKLAGNAPLTVAFDGSGSFDLDDEPLTYAWNFGDGGTSTVAKPSHTFTGSAAYTVRLTVTDQLGATGTTTLTINTGNNPPVLTVTNDGKQPPYSVGDTILLTPSATDPEDGNVPRSAITFQQIIHHCPTPGNCHLHPGAVTTAPASGSYSVVMPDHGDDSYLEVVATATDSAGASTSKSITLATEEHNLSISSAPSGVSIVVNGTNSIANPVLKEVANSQNRVIAPTTSGNLVFMRWADDATAAADRTITMPHADLALQAQYDTRPTVVAGATPTSGTAPLAVQFNSTGSTDPDAGDSITSFAWTFGDGTTGTGAAPAHTYTANGSYTATLTATDTRGNTGTATVTVTVGATGTAIPAPWAGGWQINGQASVTTPSGPLTLTPNVAQVAGTAFWPTAVPTANLTASFDLRIDQGNGADGMAFVLGNPATGALPTMVGGSAGALGTAGIPGIAVTFDTFKNTNDPSNNFVGVATTGSGLLYAQTSTTVPPLRNATIHVDVVVSSGQVKVSLNGTQYLNASITVPVNAYVGFSGSTGGLTDRHMISAFTATYGGTAPPPPAQVSVTPTSLAFGEVAVGASLTKTFSIANTGGSPLTVTSVTGPAAPFSMTGAPAAGSTIQPGGSVTVTVRLAPTQTGTWSSSIQVNTPVGSPTVTLSGTTSATPPPAQLSVTPASLPFGTVSVGTSATKTFSIANTGGAALTVNSVGAPALPFTMSGAPANNTVLNGGQSVTVTVQFAPTAAGTFTSSIPIATTAGSASVALTGATPTGGGTLLPAPWAGGWQVNGQATISAAAGSLTMTPNVGAASGSAFWPTAVATANLHATFNLTIDQGNGADGAAFVLGNPASGARPTMVGGSGGALGAAGIPGVAVTFDTFQNTGDPSNNFIGIAVSGGGLTYSGRTTTAIPTLRNSTQAIDIQVAAGVLTVKVGGVTKLTSTLALPATAYVGFTASTGGLTDRHMVTAVSISV